MKEGKSRYQKALDKLPEMVRKKAERIAGVLIAQYIDEPIAYGIGMNYALKNFKKTIRTKLKVKSQVSLQRKREPEGATHI